MNQSALATVTSSVGVRRRHERQRCSSRPGRSLKPVPVMATTQSAGPLVGATAVTVVCRERRGLEAEHHQGHRNPDSGYASTDVPFTQTHSIVLSFRIDITFLHCPSLSTEILSRSPPSWLNALPWARRRTPSKGGEEPDRTLRLLPRQTSQELLSSMPTTPLPHIRGCTTPNRERLQSAKVARRVASGGSGDGPTRKTLPAGVDRDPHSRSGVPTVTRPDRAASITAPTRLLTPSLP